MCEGGLRILGCSQRGDPEAMRMQRQFHPRHTAPLAQRVQGKWALDLLTVARKGDKCDGRFCLEIVTRGGIKQAYTDSAECVTIPPQARETDS